MFQITNQQKNDLEILNKSFKKLKTMISQVNNDLAEIEDKLMPIKLIKIL